MYLREAIPIDLPRLTGLYITHLTSDKILDYLYPHRQQYLADNAFFSLLMLKKHLYSKKTTVMVAIIEEQDLAISERGTVYAGDVVG